MFGLRNPGRRTRRGAFGGSNLRNAALAGVGLLAWRWWRNRKTSNQAPAPEAPPSSRTTSTEDTW